MTEFAPEVIAHIGSFPITNTILNTLAVDALIISGVYYLNKNFKKIPGMFQNTMEMAVETLYNFNEQISGEHAKKIFPFFMTFLIFILLTNWTGLIPGHGSFGLKEKGHLVPIFRNGTSDLNVTIALSLVSLIATHYLSLTTLGIKEYFSRYFSLNPIYLFVGILEIVSEITKGISLSFRLFGNIFAGEVLLATIGALAPLLAPIPFIALELIAGFVQALVFSMLTMIFMTMLMTSHSEGSH